jgi:hypothetical protein
MKDCVLRGTGCGGAGTAGSEDTAQILQEVLMESRYVERLPSQLITPVNGILSLLLNCATVALLPAPDAQGCGALERK